MNSDWDLTREEWSMMSRCNSCARQLYQGNLIAADVWAEKAFNTWRQRGICPERIRDKQAPNLFKLLSERKPKVIYYP